MKNCVYAEDVKNVFKGSMMLVKGLSVGRNVNSSVIESWQIFNALTFIISIPSLHFIPQKLPVN